MPKSSTTGSNDEFAVLAAVWILACQDENPMMTYEGVTYRLKLSPQYDVRSLIRCHGELFRQGLPPRRLEAWKQEMRVHKLQRPSWIKALATEEAQLAAVDGLVPGSGFRSQFRAESGVPKSELPILDWGLQHIERLRKATVEERQMQVQTVQLWAVIGLGVVNLIVSVIIALMK